MAQDDTYQTNVYHEREGDKEIVTSGGIIEIQSVGTIDISTEGMLNIQSGGLLKALSGGYLSAESSFNFFNVDEGVTAAHMRNFLMGRFSVFVHGNSDSAIGSEEVLSDLGGSNPPVLPSREHLVILSLWGAADDWSARMCSSYEGQECIIIVKGAATTSGILLFSADTAADNISGVNCIGTNGDSLSSILMWGSAVSKAMVKLVGLADGAWAVVETGSHTATVVTEQVMT